MGLISAHISSIAPKLRWPAASPQPAPHSYSPLYSARKLGFKWDARLEWLALTSRLYVYTSFSSTKRCHLSGTRRRNLKYAAGALMTRTRLIWTPWYAYCVVEPSGNTTHVKFYPRIPRSRLASQTPDHNPYLANQQHLNPKSRPRSTLGRSPRCCPP